MPDYLPAVLAVAAALALAIVFTTLKLTGFVGWSWATVLSPIWGLLLLWLGLIALAVTIALFITR